MKKILFILTACMLSVSYARAADFFDGSAAFTLAKAVKLGRSNSHFTQGFSSLNSNEIKDLPETIDCDANCASCNTATGICSACAADRYLSSNMCPACPEKSYCDGKTAVPNCQGVNCLANSTPVADNSGCCCIANCSGVTCKAGYTPVANATGCCCA